MFFYITQYFTISISLNYLYYVLKVLTCKTVPSKQLYNYSSVALYNSKNWNSYISCRFLKYCLLYFWYSYISCRFLKYCLLYFFFLFISFTYFNFIFRIQDGFQIYSGIFFSAFVDEYFI